LGEIAEQEETYISKQDEPKMSSHESCQKNEILSFAEEVTFPKNTTQAF